MLSHENWWKNIRVWFLLDHSSSLITWIRYQKLSSNYWYQCPLSVISWKGESNQKKLQQPPHQLRSYHLLTLVFLLIIQRDGTTFTVQYSKIGFYRSEIDRLIHGTLRINFNLLFYNQLYSAYLPYITNRIHRYTAFRSHLTLWYKIASTIAGYILLISLVPHVFL